MKLFYENTPLSDECLKAFIIWYKQQYRNTHIYNSCYWDDLPFEMQYTVYIDFFLSNDMEVDIKGSKKEGYWTKINNKVYKNPMPLHLARVEAVREGSETYNK